MKYAFYRKYPFVNSTLALDDLTALKQEIKSRTAGSIIITLQIYNAFNGIYMQQVNSLHYFVQCGEQ